METIKPIVEAWIDAQSADMQQLFMTNHLDEIGLKRRRYSFALCVEIFRIGADLLRARGSDLKFLLHIALEPGDSLIAAPSRQLADYAQRRNIEEPPSLYLLTKKVYLAPSDWEDYRFPLKKAIRGLPKDSYLVYYRQYRSQEYVQQNYEYLADICFETFPRDGP